MESVSVTLLLIGLCDDEETGGVLYYKEKVL